MRSGLSLAWPLTGRRGSSDPQRSRTADLCQGFGRSMARVAGWPGSSLESNSARASGLMKRPANLLATSGEESPARSRQEAKDRPAPGGRSAGSTKECAGESGGELHPGVTAEPKLALRPPAQILSRASSGPRRSARASALPRGRRQARRPRGTAAPTASSLRARGRRPGSLRCGRAGLGPPIPWSPGRPSQRPAKGLPRFGGCARADGTPRLRYPSGRSKRRAACGPSS